MDESVRAALGAGTTVLYDGQWWEVAELAPPSVLLAAAGTLRRVSVSHLLTAALGPVGCQKSAWPVSCGDVRS